MLILCPFPSSTLTAPVKERLCLDAIYAPKPAPNQSQKTYESARWRAEDRAADLSNLGKTAELKPISGKDIRAFPIARGLHPAASTLSDLSTRATPHDTSLTHWPASKNLRLSCR